jgi:hypothetical protein
LTKRLDPVSTSHRGQNAGARRRRQSALEMDLDRHQEAWEAQVTQQPSSIVQADTGKSTGDIHAAIQVRMIPPLQNPYLLFITIRISRWLRS